jgi:TonB family protein
MVLNSTEIIRPLTLLSISAVLLIGNANGLSLAVETPHEVSTRSQASREWNRYTVKGGEFSVLLPTAPAMSTYELRSDPSSKGRTRHIIGAYFQGVVYAIYVTERKQSLEDFIGKSAYASSGEFKRDLTVGGFRGKEYAFQDSSIKRVTQYFITNRYIYTFLARGSYLGNPDGGIPRFFESISFEPNTTGIPIVDGPGEQPAVETTAATEGSEARIFSGKEVAPKAMVITKPEPTYTDEARNNQVTGTVILRCVFSSSGSVTKVRLVSGLPFGLSEKAMEVARQIRFVPAIKDGHFASMYIQLEYNFSLY